MASLNVCIVITAMCCGLLMEVLPVLAVPSQTDTEMYVVTACMKTKSYCCLLMRPAHFACSGVIYLQCLLLFHRQRRQSIIC